MSILATGRINQKLRTRNALVEAASGLLREGKSFTVGDVADLANVGRTTAYRYFPSVDTLIAQASTHAVAVLNEQNLDAMLKTVPSPAVRLQLVFESADESVHDHDHLFRTMLRLSLAHTDESEDHPPRRSGIRQQIITSAISSERSRLGDKIYERLLASLTILIGIEAEVVLSDVCLLPRDKVREVKLWAAQALLQAAELEAQQAPRPRRKAAKAEPKAKARARN